MNDYSNDMTVQAVRAGHHMWIRAGEEPVNYDYMDDDHISNCIAMMERVKGSYDDIAEEFEQKIMEMQKYLKQK